MARLDTSGYTPVIILGDAEWLSLRAVAMGGRILKDRVARRLRRSGVLDDQGITPSAAPALHGVAGAVRHLDVARFEPTRRGYRAEAWIGPQRATIVKHEPDGYHVYGLDECEVPSAFTELLDVRPRPNIDLGPRLLPQQVYSIIDSGEPDALTDELAGLARRLDRGAPHRRIRQRAVGALTDLHERPARWRLGGRGLDDDPVCSRMPVRANP